MKYVTYYRVSTQRQNLGLEAQRDACNAFLSSKADAEEIGSFSEKESGKDNDRAELAKAVELAMKEDAVLLVAKLDRLTRDVAFGMELRAKGLRVRALNCPEFGDDCTLMLSIMLGLAQQERELISARTKAALQAKKERGEMLGNPANFTKEGRAMGVDAIKRNARNNTANLQAYAVASAMKDKGDTDSAVCRNLNTLGFKTRTGKQWTPKGVANLLKLMGYRKG